MASLAMKILAAAFVLVCGHAMLMDVSIDFGAESVGVWKTTSTLQVVSNPLLDREFVVNGTRIPNPIHGAAWKSLRDLGADHVRFQPWFPYPHKAVAELDAPVPGKPTSWNFTSFLPQMQDFMANTAGLGHPVIWNIGTIPCWMFYGPTTNNGRCPYPQDPDTSDFGYGERGIRPFFLKDKSGKMLADYYARVMSFLINGYMVDENDHVLSGGPKFNFSKAAGHIFEFLNEGEHYYNEKEYVHDYDVTVPAIQSALGPEKEPYFMGIGGCHDGHWNWWFMPNCSEWLPEYLDRSKHSVSDVPLDYASIHYYATTQNRSNVNDYTRDFFGSADEWLTHLDGHIATRDRLSPQTKLALTELGILMIDDMTKVYPESDGGLPDIFFNAAGAFMAYALTNVAMKGIDIACFSQFVGSPPIEKWGIKDMQFPSGAMISWETGLGNAKYWVLKLFLDHVQKGDLIQKAAVALNEDTHEAPVTEHMCYAVGPWTFNNQITLTCNDPHAVIDSIWADMGYHPHGQCGNFTANSVCSNSMFATPWAELQCLFRNECTLTKVDRLTQFLVCPVGEFVTHKVNPFSQQLTVQARCTGKKGGHTSATYKGDAVFSVGLLSPDKKTKKLLLINKKEHPIDVKIDANNLGDKGATAYIVDPTAVSRSSANGIRQEIWSAQTPGGSTVVTLQPYAVVMAVVNEATAAPSTVFV